MEVKSYELTGIEHIPKGPGIIIYHHGVAPLGYALFAARYFLETGRGCFSLIHHIVYWIPGLQMFYYVIRLKSYKKAEIVEIMKKGHLLGIAPGGGREALYSHDYCIMWGKRTGFAQAALEAKVPRDRSLTAGSGQQQMEPQTRWELTFDLHRSPQSPGHPQDLFWVLVAYELPPNSRIQRLPIIPIFTQNSCEAYRTIGKTRLTTWLYEKTRCMVLPIYGGFPVKLRTFIGEPIPYDPNITAVELAERAKIALENLRDKHQKRPGNILRALSERFDKHYKAN
ncbi:DGAT1/2-independent enzyme synthesizing storage lipids-like [Podarcis muralis]